MCIFSTANGDSGCCSSPGLESTQSTMSSMSNISSVSSRHHYNTIQPRTDSFSSPSFQKKQSPTNHTQSKQAEHQPTQNKQGGTLISDGGKRNDNKDEQQDERLPCEFCGELRCHETIMRHQVINIDQTFSNMRKKILYSHSTDKSRVKTIAISFISETL